MLMDLSPPAYSRQSVLTLSPLGAKINDLRVSYFSPYASPD
jgi:hypothetical protein